MIGLPRGQPRPTRLVANCTPPPVPHRDDVLVPRSPSHQLCLVPFLICTDATCVGRMLHGEQTAPTSGSLLVGREVLSFALWLLCRTLLNNCKFASKEGLQSSINSVGTTGGPPLACGVRLSGMLRSKPEAGPHAYRHQLSTRTQNSPSRRSSPLPKDFAIASRRTRKE